MSRTLLTIVIISLLAPQRGEGQLLELQPGVRVRLTAPPALGSRYDGLIAGRRGDTLSLLRSGQPPFDLTLGQLTTVELFRGTDRWAGARVGAVWGTGIGLVVGAILAISDNPMSSYCPGQAEPCALWTDVELTAETTLVGALYGAIFGAWKGRERWEPLELPRRVSVGRVAPGGRRARLGVRLAF